MKNSIKIMAALKQAFPGHSVELFYKSIRNQDDLYIDDYYVGTFEHDFLEYDLDNPEIEIKVKAPKNKITAFVNNCNLYKEDIHEAVERGLAEWEEKSQHKAESEDAPILKMLSNLDLSMSYVLESDHRSFTNRETGNGWLFDKIIDWRKTIQTYIKEEG